MLKNYGKQISQRDVFANNSSRSNKDEKLEQSTDDDHSVTSIKKVQGKDNSSLEAGIPPPNAFVHRTRQLKPNSTDNENNMSGLDEEDNASLNSTGNLSHNPSRIIFNRRKRRLNQNLSRASTDTGYDAEDDCDEDMSLTSRSVFSSRSSSTVKMSNLSSRFLSENSKRSKFSSGSNLSTNNSDIFGSRQGENGSIDDPHNLIIDKNLSPFQIFVIIRPYLMAVFYTIGFIMSCYSTLTCHLITLQIGFEPYNIRFNSTLVQMGPFSFKDSDTGKCLAYPEKFRKQFIEGNNNKSWMTSRVGSIFGLLAGWFAFVIIWIYVSDMVGYFQNISGKYRSIKTTAEKDVDDRTVEESKLWYHIFKINNRKSIKSLIVLVSTSFIFECFKFSFLNIRLCSDDIFIQKVGSERVSAEGGCILSTGSYCTIWVLFFYSLVIILLFFIICDFKNENDHGEFDDGTSDSRGGESSNSEINEVSKIKVLSSSNNVVPKYQPINTNDSSDNDSLKDEEWNDPDTDKALLEVMNEMESTVSNYKKALNAGENNNEYEQRGKSPENKHE